MIKPGFFAVSVFISLRPHQLDDLCSVISQNTGTKSDFSATFTQKLEEIACQNIVSFLEKRLDDVDWFVD